MTRIQKFAVAAAMTAMLASAVGAEREVGGTDMKLKIDRVTAGALQSMTQDDNVNV